MYVFMMVEIVENSTFQRKLFHLFFYFSIKFSRIFRRHHSISSKQRYDDADTSLSSKVIRRSSIDDHCIIHVCIVSNMCICQCAQRPQCISKTARHTTPRHFSILSSNAPIHNSGESLNATLLIVCAQPPEHFRVPDAPRQRDHRQWLSGVRIRLPFIESETTEQKRWMYTIMSKPWATLKG